MTAIHQVVAGAAPRDAITTHVLAARDLIRARGLRSEIFADPDHISHDLRESVHSDRAWSALTRPGDVAILHYSIDSPAFHRVLEAGGLPALHYHNVTPAELLWTFNPGLAAQCAEGRRRLAELSSVTRWAAADSNFNADEMRELGFTAPLVTGILRAPRRSCQSHSGGADGDPIRLLFVGRGVPNKAQHDCILAIAALAQVGVPVELHLIGSWGGSASYARYCDSLARIAGVSDRVAFHGSVSDDDLAIAYARSDYFLCLSDHEGFCVPVIEALEVGLPVIAYGAGATAETLGCGGIVLEEKRPSIVSEAVIAAAAGEIQCDDQSRLRQIYHHSAQSTGARINRFIDQILADARS